jgi:hypothetical protein
MVRGSTLPSVLLHHSLPACTRFKISIWHGTPDPNPNPNLLKLVAASGMEPLTLTLTLTY